MVFEDIFQSAPIPEGLSLAEYQKYIEGVIFGIGVDLKKRWEEDIQKEERR